MAMQQVEYEFPDPDSKTTEVEVNLEEKEDNSLEIEGAVGREDMQVPAKQFKADDIEIEIEDDTPVADRGRKPSKPPEEVTDESWKTILIKLKGVLSTLVRVITTSVELKKTAMREREELENYARNLISEKSKLKGTVNKNQEILLNQAKQTVASEMANAKRQYKEAYEEGDPDALIDAQEALTTAKIRTADKVANFKPTPLQEKETPVQVPERYLAPAIQRDEQAVAWADENSWFGSDDEMTAFALGLDSKLKKEGVDPQSNTYYEKINARMRQVFPDQFDEEPESTKRKSSNVVAPATRSTSPRKVVLKQSQVAIAKRLGIPLEEYAKQAAKLMREQ
jgi:hypothetical protein